MAKKDSPTLALISIAITLLAWASAFVVIRSLASILNPGGLALGRIVTGTICLGCAQLVFGRWVQPTRKEWLQIAACGAMWFGIYMLALNYGERMIDAGTAAMLVNIGPIFTAILAGIFLKERLTRWSVIGLAVAFIGATMIALSSRHSKSIALGGIALCLIAALAYAIGMIMQKPVLKRIPALQTTFLCCASGMILVLPWGGAVLHDVASNRLWALLAILYLGLVPTAIAFGTWSYALARTPAGKLAMTTYIVPPLTIVLSVILLREIPPLLAIIGGITCLVGVGLSRITPSEDSAQFPHPAQSKPVRAAIDSRHE